MALLETLGCEIADIYFQEIIENFKTKYASVLQQAKDGKFSESEKELVLSKISTEPVSSVLPTVLSSVLKVKFLSSSIFSVHFNLNF